MMQAGENGDIFVLDYGTRVLRSIPYPLSYYEEVEWTDLLVTSINNPRAGIVTCTAYWSSLCGECNDAITNTCGDCSGFDGLYSKQDRCCAREAGGDPTGIHWNTECNQCTGPEGCVCDEGYWGATCTNTCFGCASGCEITTGVCNGACDATFFTQFCNRTCPTHCSTGGATRTCDQTTGLCSECENNEWHGEDCQTPCGSCSGGTCAFADGACTPCVGDYWGFDCKSSCPSGCDVNGCNQGDGKCVDCLTGSWGDWCNNTCGNCEPDGCVRTDGTCSVCDPGYYGSSPPYCSETCPSTCDVNPTFKTCDMTSGKCDKCPVGKWGADCSLDCSFGCDAVGCNQDDAKCTDACIANRWGDFCNETCSGCASPGCHQANGLCFGGCNTPFFGPYCDEACDDTCAECNAPSDENRCTVCKEGAHLFSDLFETSCVCDSNTWGWMTNLCKTDCSSQCDRTHGFCSAFGLCDVCLGRYEGSYCNTDENSGNSERSRKGRSGTIRAKRGSSTTIGGRRAAEVSTIRSSCQNDKWTLVVDTDYQLLIYGEETGCTHCIGGNPDIVDTSLWVSGGLGYPMDVTCTFDSLFVLTSENVLFEMGTGTYNELSGGPIHTFTQVETDVFIVKASYHSVYVVKTTQTITTDVYDILSKGTNTFGSLGDGSQTDSNTLIAVDNSAFPANEYPRVVPVEFGVFFFFSGNEVWFAGKDHPSLGYDAIAGPVLLNFSTQQESQLKNNDAIDFVGRSVVRDGSNTGCLLIISDTRLYVSGDISCNSVSALQSNGPLPYEFTVAQYGTYANEKVQQFDCGTMCYLMTLDESVPDVHLFVLGEDSGDDGIDLDADCTSSPCEVLTRADTTNSYSFVIPVVSLTPGVITVEETIPSLNSFNQFESAQFPPTVIAAESGFLSGDILTLEIQKPEVFQQLESQITFHGATNDICSFPGEIGSSIWSSWNDDSSGSSTDYYKSELQWSQHRLQCGWESAEIGGYEVYSNTIKMNENFYLGIFNGEVVSRSEEFEMFVQVKFNQNVLGAISIDIENGAFDYDVLILRKDFDVSSRNGKITFKIITTYPMVVAQADANDDDILIDSYTVGAPGFYNGVPIISPQATYSCDPVLESCEQTFEVSFQMSPTFCDDHQSGASVDFTVEFDTECVSGQESHYNCFDEAVQNVYDNNQFTLLSDVESTCGQLDVTVEPTMNCEVYADWEYSAAPVTFSVDEWVYFKCEGSIMNGETITDFVIDDVWFNCDYSNDGDCNVFADTVDLYIDGSPTEGGVGQYGSIVIDDLSVSDGVAFEGFHFKLDNFLTKLQPGSVSQPFFVSVHAIVSYAGGAKRRRRIVFGGDGLDSVNIFVENPRVHKQFLPIVLNTAILMCVFLICGVFVGSAILLGTKEIQKRKMKKNERRMNIEMEILPNNNCNSIEGNQKPEGK